MKKEWEIQNKILNLRRTWLRGLYSVRKAIIEEKLLELKQLELLKTNHITQR